MRTCDLRCISTRRHPGLCAPWSATRDRRVALRCRGSVRPSRGMRRRGRERSRCRGSAALRTWPLPGGMRATLHDITGRPRFCKVGRTRSCSFRCIATPPVGSGATCHFPGFLSLEGHQWPFVEKWDLDWAVADPTGYQDRRVPTWLRDELSLTEPPPDLDPRRGKVSGVAVETRA